MKHLAIRSMSIRKKDQPYTTPGLGDMTHTILIGYLYGLKNNIPVTLHLTSDKWNRDKPDTYRALLDLLPRNCVYIKVHPVSGVSDEDFIKYIHQQGIDAELYCYMDIRHKYDTIQVIDISNYFKIYPCLPAQNLSSDIQLPDKFVTSQWDSTAQKRRLSEHKVSNIKEYYRSQGYDIITLGGDAENSLLRRSLKHIGYAMSRAQLHIGVDSGYMHFAQLYLKPEQIHIYVDDSCVKWSHHLIRAVNNGCIINYYKEYKQL